MDSQKPAVVFPPGEILKDELAERGWNQTDLAEILGRGVTVVNEILSGKRGITPETAQSLADALGGSAQFWLNLESMYRLSLVEKDDKVSMRARLYAKAPVREMIRRNWLEESTSVDVLWREVLDFYGIENLEDDPAFAHAARKSTSYDDPPTPSQQAWLYRARQLAPAVSVTRPYSKKRMPSLIRELHALTEAPENTRVVPRLLSEYGIHFLLIEPLAGTRIDGAAFWLGKSPVAVVSLRYDRIDHFWHTLMHELGHILHRDGPLLDLDIVSDKGQAEGGKPDYEIRADEFAANALIPIEKLDDYIIRVRPLFSARRVQAFARTMHVHAGIVVGQLQHRHEISYANLRKLLVPVRQVITATALTDGWGSQLPASF